MTEIAEIFDIKPRTVIGHLWEAVITGEHIDPEPLLAESHYSAEEHINLGVGSDEAVLEAEGWSLERF